MVGVAGGGVGFWPDTKSGGGGGEGCCRFMARYEKRGGGGGLCCRFLITYWGSYDFKVRGIRLLSDLTWES